MRAFSLIVALVLVAVAAPCAAQDRLAAARSAYADGALDRAQRAYEAALAAGDLDPAALAEAELYLGVIARAASDPEAMRAHFDRAVAVDPTIQAPSELPPRGRRVLEAARSARSGAAITIRVEVPPLPADGPVPVRAVVEAAPRDLITELRFTLGGFTVTVDATAGVAEIPAREWPQEPGDLRVDALTSAHNVASRVHVAVPARAAPPLSPPQLSVADSRPSTGRTGPRVEHRRIDPIVGTGTGQDDTSSVFEEPAFWIVVSLIVVGAAVGAVLALTLQDSYVVGVPRVEALTFP